MPSNSNIKAKQLGVSVHDLTVVGLAPENSIIKTNLTPFLKVGNLFKPSYWYVLNFFL
jgi:hypothetical protein